MAHLELKPLGKKPISQLDVLRGIVHCRCHHNSFGSPAKFANHVLQCHLFRNASFCTQFNDALKKQQKVCVRTGWPMAPYIRSLDGDEIELAKLNFHAHATHATAPIDFKSYQLQGGEMETQMIQHATADVAGQRVQFLFRGSDSSKKLVVQFGKCPQE